jgi:quercetin dioxygenase-like cupin family protein
MRRIMIPVIAMACMLAAAAARADDPVKVDPKHYKVEFENDVVRILRIRYGPGEKSVMHSHPDGVVIYLTDAETKMTFPDGTTVANSGKAGTVQAAPGGPHLPQNTGTKAMELLLVEFKTKPVAP